MTLDSRVAALVDMVVARREAECRAQVDPAGATARQMLTQARRAASARVHAAIAEERAAFAARASRAEAHLATRKRMAHQELVRALLHDGRERLAAALAARWIDAAARGRWIDAALRRALAVLPRGQWTISFPPSWDESERNAAVARLAADGVSADCVACTEIDAGLRIDARGIVLDATPAGLLEDRAAVEGRLLHFIEDGTS